MIQLFASDMDGTILKDHLTIHPDNVKAIFDLQRLGRIFIICTGRDYLQAQLCLKPAGVVCPVIAYNGALAYDEKGQLLWEVSFSHDEVRQVVHQLESAGQDWQIMTNKGIFTLHYEERFMKRIRLLKEEHPTMTPEEFEIEVAKLRALFHAHDVSTLDEVLTDDSVSVYKITSMNEQTMGEVYEGVKAYIANNLPDLVVTSSYHTNIEVNHKDAQKGLAVQRYAQKLGLTMDEVFAVGDNSNDASMIEMAGFGVAMENGSEHVKSIADYVTTTNTDGGVAKAIHYVLSHEKA